MLGLGKNFLTNSKFSTQFSLESIRTIEFVTGYNCLKKYFTIDMTDMLFNLTIYLFIFYFN